MLRLGTLPERSPRWISTYPWFELDMVKKKKKIKRRPGPGYPNNPHNSRPLPQQAAELLRQGEVLEGNGQFAEALIFYRQSQLHAPDREEIYLRLGNLLEKLGRVQDLIELYRGAIMAGVKTVNIYGRLGQVLGKTGQHRASVAVLQEAVEKHPRESRLYFSLGEALIVTGRIEEALESYGRSANLNPRFVQALIGQGRAYMYLGDKAEALKCMRRVLQLDPRNVGALFNMASLKKYREYDDDVRTMEFLFNQGSLAPIDQERLSFALGKIFEELQDHDKAFDYIAEGNRLHRRGYDYDPVSDDSSWLLELFSDGFMADRAGCGATGSIRPVFILGMPRSGTTLVEQILSSHPLVFGGESCTV